MKREVFVLMVVLVLASSFVFADSPSPKPVCYIEGTIQSFEFQEAVNQTADEDCVGCQSFVYPARYMLDVNIESVSYVSGDASYITCENLYPLNEEKPVFIREDELNEGDSLETGQEIKGQLSEGSFGLYFDSYELIGTPPDEPPIEINDTGTNGDTEINDSTNGDIEPSYSNTKLIAYLIVGIGIVIILVIIICFLIKGRSHNYQSQDSSQGQLQQGT